MRIIVTFFIISIGNLYSQSIFFIKPTFDSKLFVGTTDNTLSNFTLFNNNAADNPYFQVKNNLLSYRSIIHFGLNIGIYLNNKHTIELGWSQDGAGSSWQTKMMTWDTTNYGLQNFSDNGSISQSYIYYNKISLNYQYQISNNEKRTNFGLSFGMGLLFNPRKKNNSPPPSITYGQYSSGENLTMLDEKVSMPIQESEMFAFTRNSGYLSFGIYSDIYIKHKYILSFSLSYLQGFKFMEHSVHRYLIVDDNIEKRFIYTSSSRGSGIYLHLYRKFQFYPWIPLSKKKNLKL